MSDLTAMSPASIPAWLLLGVLGGWLSVIDAREHRLPNRILLPGTLAAFLLIGAASAWNHDLASLLRAALGAAVTFAVLLLLALPRTTGMGMGDVKLGLLTGAYLGWLGWSWVLLGLCCAFLLAGGWATALLATGRARRRSRIAFGPFMVAGAVASAIGVAVLTMPAGSGGLSG